MPQKLSPRAIPEYTLALFLIRSTLLDALDGYGLSELDYLLRPTPQLAIARLTGSSHPRELTERTIERLREMDQEERQAVRHALTWRSWRQMREIFNGACRQNPHLPPGA